MNASMPAERRKFSLLPAVACTVTLMLVAACGSRTAEMSQSPANHPVQASQQAALSDETEPSPSLAVANPASQHCIEEGGRLRIEKTPRGDEFGICLFEDNYQCEEWALLRGECRKGGVRITGYATQAARYCAITGGRYQSTREETATAEEGGTCTFANGKHCDVHDYFAGDCRKI
jgi:putative hemolysin